MRQAKAPFLKCLNTNQLEAVTAPIDKFVEIIAGPGTGKTSVLTARVAYLLINNHVKPDQLIVTTFTRKAAQEMKERLKNLLKDNTEVNLSKLRIGTFHSICLMYLKFFGKLIGLSNFKIATDSDQKDIFNSIPKLNSYGISDKVKLGDFRKFLAKQKAHGLWPDQVGSLEGDDDQKLRELYADYQKLLRKNNFIDLDDILIYTRDLLKTHPQLVKYIRHVLVDEFQDTNIVQLDLIQRFASGCNNNITIVGDADQSIYGFRHANYENYKLIESAILQNNGEILKIYLDQNYRSTSNILRVAESVMSKQNERDEKQLISNHAHDHLVNLQHFQSNSAEAEWIVKKIVDLCQDHTYTYKDICVIVRSAKIFSKIERSLNKRFIPYVVLRGSVFWKLKEILMILDVLKTISYYDVLSFIRVLEWYGKGCGPKFISNFKAFMDSEPGVVLNADMVMRIANNEHFKVNSKQKETLINITRLVEECREKLHSCELEEFIDCAISSFKIKSIAFDQKSNTNTSPSLEEEINDNLSEFKSLFLEYNLEDDETFTETQKEIFQSNLEIKLDDETSDEVPKEKYLSYFLTYCNISTNAISKGDTEKGAVTLSTIHASKGLEWSVVFLPALMNNKLPSIQALRENDEKALDEERRCLYVAITRAKDHLYLSTYFEEGCDLSMFLKSVPSELINKVGSMQQLSPMFSRPGSRMKSAFYSNFTFQSKLQGVSEKNLKFEAASSIKLSKQKTHVGSRPLPPRAPPPPQVVGASGVTYNPVTGAVMGSSSLNPAKITKKKRLGTGRSLKDVLSRKN